MNRLLAICFLFTVPVFGQLTVSSIYPGSGPAAGGTLVHIAGTRLSAPVTPCPTCAPTVTFGNTAATVLTESDTEIVVEAPPHSTGVVNVMVDVAGSAVTVPTAFRYEDPPVTELEKILIPIALGFQVPGAFGSLWSTDITFYNASNEPVQVLAPNCNPILFAPCPPNLNLAPGATSEPTLFGIPGAFVEIPRRNVDQIDITLRIQDISRQAQTWGTALPVARATDFRKIVRMSGVPTNSRFRSTLRVYGYGGPHAVIIRVFDPSMPQPLTERSFVLQQSGNPELIPSYLQIDPVGQLTSPDRIRVEVTSPNPIWAFISVTNNETQHVTIIAPE